MNLPRRFSSERSEAGETLLEVLISSALMAIAVVAVIGGISTVLLGSSIHRTQGNANHALVQAVENMKAMPFSQVACSSTEVEPAATAARIDKYKAAAGVPAGWSVSVAVMYERLNAGTIDFGGTTCSPALPFQLVTVKITSPDTKVSPSMTFVKGDV